MQSGGVARGKGQEDKQRTRGQRKQDLKEFSLSQ